MWRCLLRLPTSGLRQGRGARRADNPPPVDALTAVPAKSQLSQLYATEAVPFAHARGISVSPEFENP